jgi:hypothetical protein
MGDEARLHDIIENRRGEWEIKTSWGTIKVAFRPLRIHYTSAKGVPDELIIAEVSFCLFGEWISLQAPILLEVEEKGGTAASLEDLRKFSERSCTGEQKSYVKLPMLVIGKERKSRTEQILLNIEVNITEVSKSILHD